MSKSHDDHYNVLLYSGIGIDSLLSFKEYGSFIEGRACRFYTWKKTKYFCHEPFVALICLKLILMVSFVLKNYSVFIFVYGERWERCIVGLLCNYYKILLLRVSMFGLKLFKQSLLFSLRRAFSQWLSFAIFQCICYQCTVSM